MTKRATKKYKIDIQPGGRGQKRYRRSFNTKAEAEQYKIWAISEYEKHKNDPAWTTRASDKRTLNDLIERWYKLHGSRLKDGPRRKNILLNISEHLGNPIASKLTENQFSEYITERLDAEEKPITQNTANRHRSYMQAVFSKLIKLKEWNGKNPVAGVEKLKFDEKKMTYLDNTQIKLLLHELENSQNKSVATISKISLATGARWSEAENLSRSQVNDQIIAFTKTKSSKVRYIPISKELEQEIIKNLPFSRSLPSFRLAMKRTKIILPKGQSAHVLRHTFASHFMKNGGDIITLKNTLGHSSINMTMRYAHLAPDHLKDVLTKNPLDNL